MVTFKRSIRVQRILGACMLSSIALAPNAFANGDFVSDAPQLDSNEVASLIPICSSTDSITPGRSDVNGMTNGEIDIRAVDVMPDFPGGLSALMQFLSQNIKYPKEAQEANVQGRVVVSFVVQKDGSISDSQVVKGFHPALDAEALRVVSLMPAWTPAMQDGHHVRVRFTIPINFKIPPKSTKKTR